MSVRGVNFKQFKEKTHIFSNKILVLFSNDNLVDNYLQNESSIPDDNSSVNQSKISLSNDFLMDEHNYKMQNRLLTICECLILMILYLLNSFTYIYLPYGFIEAVKVCVT